MDPNFIQVIGVVFVASSFVRGLSIWTTHLEEKQRIRLTLNSQGQQLDQSAIEDLRSQIMRLRDTTTQYDMSVEQTLTEIKSRLSHVESQVGLTAAAVSAPSTPRPTLPQAPVVSQAAGETEEQKLILGGSN